MTREERYILQKGKDNSKYSIAPGQDKSNSAIDKYITNRVETRENIKEAVASAEIEKEIAEGIIKEIKKVLK